MPGVSLVEQRILNKPKVGSEEPRILTKPDVGSEEAWKRNKPEVGLQEPRIPDEHRGCWEVSVTGVTRALVNR